MEKTDYGKKMTRVLDIYSKLLNGEIVNKKKEASIYGVNERSIQRDIEDIRVYLQEKTDSLGIINTIIYDHRCRGYRLEQQSVLSLTNAEILAVCKILLDSRALPKKEMQSILDKTIACCIPVENQKVIYELIRNEAFHYIEPRHHTDFLSEMWDIGQAIKDHVCVEILYKRMKDKSLVKRKIYPLAIMFSEYYFYLIAFIDNEQLQKRFDNSYDVYPTIYRMDRIQNMRITSEHFHIPYKDRFQEGEFRKRIQFMYGGKLRKITFTYSGMDIDAVLDRMPTAQVLHEVDGVYTVTAEVFGDGVDMWLRSQGDNVKII